MHSFESLVTKNQGEVWGASHLSSAGYFGGCTIEERIQLWWWAYASSPLKSI